MCTETVIGVSLQAMLCNLKNKIEETVDQGGIYLYKKILKCAFYINNFFTNLKPWSLLKRKFNEVHLLQQFLMYMEKKELFSFMMRH